MEDKSCLFSCENETVNHLFFECVVARQMWSIISEALSFSCGDNFGPLVSFG